MENTPNPTDHRNWRRQLSHQHWVEYLNILFDQLLKIEDQPSLSAIAVSVDIWLELMALATDLPAEEQQLINLELAICLPPEWSAWVDFTLDEVSLAQPGLQAFLQRKTPVH